MTAPASRILGFVCALALCTAGATVWALDPSQPPGGNFDLSHWKVQLPTDGGLLTCTNLGVDEATPAQLEAGFTNAYFYTGTDGAMVFWAPVNGATTSGSDNPRSELRELINPSSSSVNWIPYGTHILDAQCKVLQVANPTKKVIIGQIHAFSSAALPTVKIYYNNGTLSATVKTNSTDDLSDTKFTNYGFVGLSNNITYQIKVVNGLITIAMNNKTNSYNIFQSDQAYTNETQYFKAGDYNQDPACSNPSTNDGARVAFSAVTLFHAPSITNQPASQVVTVGSNVTFTVGAAGNPPLKYSWLFNGAPMSNKTNATLSIPNVQLTNAGNYSVVVTDFVGTVTSVVTSSVATLTVLSANFTATPTNGAAPLNVAFTDTSLGSPTSWAWSFGDTGTSTLQNPSHNYTTAGTYSVRLIASNAGGSSTNTKNAYITALPPPAPSGLSATALSETQIQLTWTDNATNETAYGVGRSLDSNSWSVLTGSLPPNSTNYTDTTCSPSTLYYYRVNCTNTSGASAYAVVSLTTPAGVGDGIPGSWRLQYFGDGLSTNGSSCATCDPDGDGQSNLAEYLAGTDPTNSASALQILSIAPQGDDIVITWQTAAGKTNALERTAGADGSFSTNFTAIFTVTNTIGTATNYLDPGAATNSPSGYYRIRLVP